jgi:hypothetical protein
MSRKQLKCLTLFVNDLDIGSLHQIYIESSPCSEDSDAPRAIKKHISKICQFFAQLRLNYPKQKLYKHQKFNLSMQKEIEFLKCLNLFETDKTV